MYTSMHFGQYSFTIASPGISDKPMTGKKLVIVKCVEVAT